MVGIGLPGSSLPSLVTPRAGLGCLWLYLIKQPISRNSDDAFPLTEAQPLDQLTGMVLSF